MSEPIAPPVGTPPPAPAVTTLPPAPPQAAGGAPGAAPAAPQDSNFAQAIGGPGAAAGLMGAAAGPLPASPAPTAPADPAASADQGAPADQAAPADPAPAAPSPAGAQATAPAGGGVQDAWMSIYNTELQNANSAKDPAMKAFWMARVQVMQATIDAMGGATGGAAGGGATGGASAGASPPPTSPTAADGTGSGTAAPPSYAPTPPAGGTSDTPNGFESIPVAPGNQNAYDGLIAAAAKKYGLDPLILKAIIRQESNFIPDIVSSAGCVGLMQLKPSTANEMGGGDLTDPATSIDLGARYYRKMLDTFNGDHYKANMAYNAGPGAANPGAVPEGQNSSAGEHASKVLGWYNDLKATGRVNSKMGALPSRM